MRFNYVVVGAGLAGCTIARLLVEQGFGPVLIVEKRNVIGGNCYDYYNEDGLLLHKYGGHIFHTKDKEVWDFLSRFTAWIYYQHKVYGYVEGQYMQFPPTLSMVKGHQLPANGMGNAEAYLYAHIGKYYTDLFYRGYSKKHWGVDLKELPASIVGRVQLRSDEDPRYFKDTYQGMPKEGYTAMITKMVDIAGIRVLLKATPEDTKDLMEKAASVIWTGKIEALCNNIYGGLPYRSLSFSSKTYDTDYYQKGAVITYPNDYDFIRSIEIKHATRQQHTKTVVTYEYPCDGGEPLYPAKLDISSTANYDRYVKRVKETLPPSVYLLGRLASYKYLDMDAAVRQAFNLLTTMKRCD